MNYPGGKGGDGVYQAIINLMPKHKIYIEPFLGGGAILRNKKPAAASYGVEPNKATFDRWREFQADSFRSRKTDFYQGELPELRFWQADNPGVAQKPVLRIYNGTFDQFAAKSGLHLENLNNKALIYLDPPYLMETRSSKSKIYGDHDFSDWFSHEELLDLLLSLKCNVMISGYDHPLYDGKLSGWRKAQFSSITRGGPRTETVWMNFAEPVELHDYRYLGKDYRERENIARQKKRWVEKLTGMDRLRRLALMSAIEEVFQAADTGENSGAISPAETPVPKISLADDVRLSAMRNAIEPYVKEFGTAKNADVSSGKIEPSVIDPHGFVGRDHTQHPTRNPKPGPVGREGDVDPVTGGVWYVTAPWANKSVLHLIIDGKSLCGKWHGEKKSECRTLGNVEQCSTCSKKLAAFSTDKKTGARSRKPKTAEVAA